MSKNSLRPINVPFKAVAGTDWVLDKTLIVSVPKIGKTQNLLQMPGNLVLDLQGGTKGYTGLKMDVKNYARDNRISVYKSFKLHIAEMKESMKGRRYNFITIEMLKEFERIAGVKGLYYYNQTVKDDAQRSDIFEIPYGRGYELLREVTEEFYDLLRPFVKYGVIWTAHAVPAALQAADDSSSISHMDLDMAGKKNKIWFTGFMDNTAVMYQEREEKDGVTTYTNYLDFIKDEVHLYSGSRDKHLAGRRFKISKRVGENTPQVRWDVIFPFLYKN